MAFDNKGFARLGSSQTNEVPTSWSYKSNDDEIADMYQFGYFNARINDFQIGDQINITDSADQADIFVVEDFNSGDVGVGSILTGDAGHFSHITIAAGEHTTLGGMPSESFLVPGILLTDLVIGSIELPNPAGNELIAIRIKDPGEVELSFQVDPGTQAVVTYMILRKFDS